MIHKILINIFLLTFTFEAMSITNKNKSNNKILDTKSTTNNKSNNKILDTKSTANNKPTPNTFISDIPISQKKLKNHLTHLQYTVTQNKATEPAFKNKYWNNKQDGIYVDIISGKPLFSSLDKYDSKTGWPTFSRPLVKDNISMHKDTHFFISRTEVRSKNSHLGHVFYDDPSSPTHTRYCINSAALKFIPVHKLNSEGYSKFKKLFKK